MQKYGQTDSNKERFFRAEVRDTQDPDKQGKYKLRIYGRGDDEENIKDEHLPWAQTLQGPHSPATQKAGQSPTGHIVGTRVFGMFLDDAHRYPIILGSFPRGAEAADPTDNTGGIDGLKQGSQGVDLPSQFHPEDNKGNYAPTHPLLGGKSIANNMYTDKYNQATIIPNSGSS